MSSSRSMTSMRNLNIPIYCHCNMQCSIYTYYKANNRGRKFYRCPRNKSEDDCRFFRWFDERNGLSEDMKHITSANAAEVLSNHTVSLTTEFLQIKMLLVILILLLVVVLNLISKCCNCK
ncbi:hypothetical protein MA16_Dca003126 [Dendrobium catenatum]|uniref:GRF-type domain-containing protein n=1 Tax=Dendrobium catenatum TaxID=906689 RepID=A0A2I0XBS9_9ASPA|nr:hypothetical protein MA16_Dca003126 [Dendrobium catenatum]